jgi:endosialidase-like protein
LNEGLDTSKWQAWNTGRAPGETTDRAAIEKAMMDSYGRATQPTQRAEDAQLVARGLSPGSQGFGTVQQGREDARGEAARQAYLGSGQEARAWAELDNTLRQAQAQESFAVRNQPINEIMALLGGSQVNLPNFSPFSRQGIGAASPGQYMASNYQNQLQMANARNQGLFGLAGAGMEGIGAAGGLGKFLAFSDRRLKEDIRPLGRKFAGVPLYGFYYKGNDVEQVGVMADEVRALHPDAIIVHDSGYDMVDYALLLRRHKDG